MVKNVKQFRYYSTDSQYNTNDLNFFKTSINFVQYAPIVHLGIQTIPGVQFYLNGNHNPMVVGATGIYELDLENTTGLIQSIYFDDKSLNIINNIPTAYLIMDIIYETEEN